MPIIPIAIFLALGAGVWALTRKSAPAASADAGAKTSPQLATGPGSTPASTESTPASTESTPASAGPATLNQAQTGPQALSRDQKIAFFKLLPSLVVVEDKSKASFDAGRLRPKAQQIASTEKSAPALGVVYKASMSGRSVLVAKDGDDTMIVVPAEGAENGFAKPGSDWFIVLAPNEADAIAKVAGIDPDKVDEAGAPVAGDGAEGKMAFRPIAGNPFRKGAVSAAATSAVKTMASALKAVSAILIGPEHNDYKLIQGPLGEQARAAVDSNSADAIIFAADALVNGGYLIAGKQLFDLARGLGWAPIDDDAVHFPLMTVDEVMHSPHKRIASFAAGSPGGVWDVVQGAANAVGNAGSSSGGVWDVVQGAANAVGNAGSSSGGVWDVVQGAANAVGNAGSTGSSLGGVWDVVQGAANAVGNAGSSPGGSSSSVNGREAGLLLARDRALSGIAAGDDAAMLRAAAAAVFQAGYQTAAEDLNAATKLAGGAEIPEIGHNRAMAKVRLLLGKNRAMGKVRRPLDKNWSMGKVQQPFGK
jgi:hypothetical protein